MRADQSSRFLERAGKRRFPASEILQDSFMRQGLAGIEVGQPFRHFRLEPFFVVEAGLERGIEDSLLRALPSPGETRDATRRCSRYSKIGHAR